MKIIKPYFEILQESDIFKCIELAGRTCYKSEDKITEDSAEKFVRMLIDRKHNAMLEHGTVYLRVKDYVSMVGNYCHNPYSKVNRVDETVKSKIGNDFDINSIYYITTNYRVIVENGWQDDLQFQCEPTEHHEKRVSVKFICDRGVSHELVRHRVFSFAQESTRYVSSINKKKLHLQLEEDIIELYESGLSMKAIAALCQSKEWDIYKILTKNNIERRGHNSKGNTNHNVFNVIDTPEKAYLMGLIQADGNVRCNGRSYFVSITQHKDNFWYIEQMIKNMVNNFPVVSKDRNCYQISICSKQIFNDLCSKGIVPNKTYVQTREDADKLWDSIPDIYKYDFLRGMLDGDGDIKFYFQKESSKKLSCNIGFTGNEHIIKKIVDYIYEQLNYKMTIRKPKDCDIIRRACVCSYDIGKKLCEKLLSNFKFPYGNPKKTSRMLEVLQQDFPYAEVGEEEFKVILPSWIDKSDYSHWIWLQSMIESENTYSKLRISLWTPQEARSILPNSLKTEIVMTGFESDWKHFFSLRCDKTAHPQMRELAIPLLKEFQKLIPNVFKEEK